MTGTNDLPSIHNDLLENSVYPSHAVPWLWCLHAVHHSDTEYDLTATYRNHPINVIMALAARLPAIIILGAPVYAIVAYELFSTAVELFAHGNVRVPRKLDKRLRYIIVTPDYHRIHHSSARRFTDSNFAGFVSLIRSPVWHRQVQTLW